MKKKSLFCIAWITLFSLLPVTMNTTSLSAQTETSAPSSSLSGAYDTKEEVIYSMLDSSGTVNQIYAVNIFNVTAAGRIDDYGSYSSVKNLTSTGDIGVNGDIVTLEAQPGRFYYQGTLTDNRLPWIINAVYSLDGTPMSPADLAGRSGHLSITLNTKADPGINGSFFDNYLLQVSITLNSSACTNIEASGATMANAGTDKLITYAIMPGTEGNLTVSADVTDFEMKGISISAVPFTMNFDLPDASEYTDDLVLLADAISGLKNGMTSLTDGIMELQTGTEQLLTGSSGFRSGIKEISNRSEELVTASGQISSALSAVSKMLHGATDGSDMSALVNLPVYLTKLSDGLGGIAGGLTELHTGYAQAFTALDAAIRSIPATEISQTDLQKLVMNNPTDATVSSLIEYYTAARTVQATYQMVSPALEAVNTKLPLISSNITTIAGTLKTMSTQLSSTFEATDLLNSIQKLTEGIDELATNYTSFHTGLKEYTVGIAQLTKGYDSVHDGISELTEGMTALGNGMKELEVGTEELNTQTASMPEQMEETMNGMLADFDTADFTPVSFLSAENTKITSVQFICKTTEIAKEDAGQDNDEVAPDESFWDRLTALFGRK